MKQKRKLIDLSVVVPVFNEESNLDDLIRAVTSALHDYHGEYEILLVDDGSTDGSFPIMKRLAAEEPRIRVIRFGINYGQTAAISAGFHFARGKVIVTMDADLQNDPTDIPALLEKIEEGFDVVSGWRKNRFDVFLTRKLPSMTANRLISCITGLKLHDYGCTLKAYRREIVRHIRLYGEMHRFIPALARWAGARVTEIAVKHHPRKSGKSKYGINRTIRVLLDLFVVKFLTTYSTQPIQIFGGLGLLCFVMAFLMFARTLELRIVNNFSMGENPMLYASLSGFVVAVQLLLMGLNAEIQARTYHESQGKPIYVVREIVQFSDMASSLPERFPLSQKQR